jgi:hypothetical protein
MQRCKMLLKAGLVALVVGISFATMYLVFAAACSYIGHSTEEALWSGWAMAILTVAVAAETIL